MAKHVLMNKTYAKMALEVLSITTSNQIYKEKEMISSMKYSARTSIPYCQFEFLSANCKELDFKINSCQQV
jgi:hypothetical protein